MSTGYSLSAVAYHKVLLHATKYAHSDICGLLLGPSGSTNVVDAIPLLHHWTALSPMMEAGLELAEVYAKTKGWDVLGFYEARKGMDENTISATGKQAALAIVKNNGGKGLVLVVDNTNIAVEDTPFIPYLPAGSNAFEPRIFSSIVTLADPSSCTAEHYKSLVKRKEHEKLSDFDDHLEGISKDWLRNDSVQIL
ncbi:hypothetical protein BT69DRAFT_1359236 [Atractiella rhizophila]|nr:hypothetical protein BT69DRAFT_1359236 [Atractiella rhizophila]